MPSSLPAILRRNRGERRSIGRTSVNRNALMFLSSQASVHACCVRDVTNLGGGIRLAGLKILPLDFDFSFDNFRTIRKCRLIWREDDFIGVRLIT
jgi:hypothetical protein